MTNRIRHNYPSLIRCIRVFHILVLTYLLFRCYYYNHYKIPKTLLLLSLLLLPLPPLSYYFATKHFAADTKFPGVVELTTQLLILENILWLPLCRINKFGLNTLPSKTVAIPYTCGLSGHGRGSRRHDRRCFGRLEQEDQRLKKHYGRWMDIVRSLELESFIY